MPTAEREALLRRLDELAQRIETRRRNFKQRGEFSALQDQLEEVAARQHWLRGRIDAVEGESWRVQRDRWLREHDLLFTQLTAIERELDRHHMLENPPGRAPGARSGLV